MAERRMFSKKITQADEFLELPVSTQLLYFHLCLEADDDGFLGKPKSVVRACCAASDDLERLVKAQYVISFPSGVVAIRHWRVHNQIRKDRYHETYYQEEFLSLTIDEQGVYRELPAPVSSEKPLATEVRIAKDRLEQVRRSQTYAPVCGSRAEIEKRIMTGKATPDDFERYRRYCRGGFNSS